MAGKQARILSDRDLLSVLEYVANMRHPERNRVMVLLSAKAGLRAGEIAQLTWSMVYDADGSIGNVIQLEDRIAKKKHGRIVPVHPGLRDALIQHRAKAHDVRPASRVIVSERGNDMAPQTVYNWFQRAYKTVGLVGCSSHSGRRTMITKAARKASQVGASLKDVMYMAGHKHMSTTQQYVEGDTVAQRKLIDLL